jgi:hypothetical protein
MIDNKHMSQFVPPAQIGKTAGTWAASVAANVPRETRTAGAGVFSLLVPVNTQQNENFRNGARLKSIDVFYKVATADCTDFATVELEKVTLPATGAAPTGATVAVTMDAGHDTAGERKVQGDHTMTVNVDAPVYLSQNEALILNLVIDPGATAVVTLYGARLNFDLRID